MKNFILRYLISYLLCAFFFILDKLIYDQEGINTLAMFLFWFLLIANLISSCIFYYLIPHIPNKTRLFLLTIIPLLFVILAISKYVLHINEDNISIIGYVFLFSTFFAPQLLIANFNSKEQELDNKIKSNYLLTALLFLFLMLWFIAIKLARE